MKNVVVEVFWHETQPRANGGADSQIVIDI